MPTSTTYPTATTLHTGGDGFIQALRQDLASASHSIAIQVMSFEADQAGRQIIELLSNYPQLKRRLLVDAYSTIVVNDTWTRKPGLSPRLHAAKQELKALWPLLQYAQANGIDIRFTNPLGLLWMKYPMRNHKKCVLIDHQISYVGGINITDHNFGWKDLMIRQQDEQVASALHASFQVDWQAGFLPQKLQKFNPATTSDPTTTTTQSTRDTSNTTPPAYQQIDPNTELYLLSGLSTKTAYHRLQTQVEQARKVEVFSPYITYPMLDSVAKVADHTVWMPEHNNKALVQLTSRLPRYRKLNIQTIPGSPYEMLHAKVMILDGETVIYGSSNFDLISYLFEQELVIVRRDAGLAQKIQAALRP
jgi:cardiolipin synthase A/B